MANLRVRDVAERLDVSSKTVYKWLREGLIPASRLGKSWIISEEALQDALAPGSNRPLASAVVDQGVDATRSSSAESSTQVSRSRDAEPIASVKPLERRTPVGRINVAVIGLGNCASSLIQGIHKYGEVDENTLPVPGVMHNVLGGYTIGDVNVVAAFDIDKEKVGVDINEAIFAKTNNALEFHDVPRAGIPVDRGMTHDGIGQFLKDVIDPAPGSTSDIVGILRDREVDVVINYLPVGSEQATKWYVEQVLAAGCAFVNCIPGFHRQSAVLAETLRRQGVAGSGRRHQVAGGCNDHPSRVGSTLRGSRGPAGPHVSVELRWQH